MASRRVLSIQSHVVCGYVGNKSATFPLQVLGFDVDAINSVQFSNHTGYKHIKGQVLDHTELDDLITGLRLNQINCYSHLLTGYIGSVSFLKHVAQVVTELKHVNPEMTYVCDPVMGDNGRMYVPEELLPVYRELIVPRADVLTPNQYEAELLTGRRISDVASACAVMDDLHARGVGTVVLSSTELGCEQALVGLASQLGVDGVRRRFRIDIPRLAASFTGSGDLFAACLLARMHESDGDLAKAFQQTIATLQDVLKRTVQHVLSETGDSISPFQIELKLVQSLESIRNPRSEVTVREIYD